MKLSPLVERELRTGARRTLLFWMRGLLALILGLQCYDLLSESAILGRISPASMAPSASSLTVAPTVMNGSLLLHHMSSLLFVALLLMGVLSADAISRERREGTLGLLLLTDLTPAQIVQGKMISCGLNSFLILLGALPALMVPVLLGGVRGIDAAITCAGLLTTLFVSLAAGLWVSAMFHERRNAIALTLALVMTLGFGAEVVGGNCFGPLGAQLFRTCSLGGWKTLADLPAVFAPLFLIWFAVVNALGWLFLWMASATLEHNWQNEPHRQVLRSLAEEVIDPWETEEGFSAETLPARASWLTDPRPWDADPIRWRVRRMGSIRAVLWLAVGLTFCWQFGMLVSFSSVSGAGDSGWGFLSFAGILLGSFGGGILAWAGARFFLDARQQLDLELLLTTVVGNRNVLSGQWQPLRDALKAPLLVVVLISLPSGISAWHDFMNEHYRQFWHTLPYFVIPINVLVEVMALGWVGMYCGLSGRNPAGVALNAVGRVQLVPLAIAAGISWAWKTLGGASWVSAGAFGTVPLVIPILALLFFKNIAFVFWARSGLRQSLRIAVRGRRGGYRSPHLVPQAA